MAISQKIGVPTNSTAVGTIGVAVDVDRATSAPTEVTKISHILKFKR